MEELKATGLKRIDFNTGVFEANGTQYTIEGGLSIERYCELQTVEKEMAFGVTFKALYDNIQRAYDLQNKQKFADVSVLLNDIIRGMVKVQEKEPFALKICTLFINAEGEDRRDFSMDLMTKKINDWKTEGIDMRDFFQVAFDSMPGYIEIYQKISRIISAQPGSEIAAK